MTEVARAVIFGRDASSYDRFRPSYPAEAIDHMLSLVDASRALEVGAGTGKATVDISGHGIEITCLEPSPSMASVLEGKGLPDVEVVVSTFEDWEGADESIDLIYAAQAWHWVDHDTAYDRALRLLRPGGVIALLWNVLLDRYDQFEDLYRLHAPEIIEERDERIAKRDHHTWSDDLVAAGFGDVRRFTHRWQTTLAADDYTSLCATYSDHMLVEEKARKRLLDAIREAAGDRGVSVEYRTEVFSGAKPDD